MKRILLSALALSLLRCTTPQHEKKSGFLSDPPAGSTLKVNKPLAISANEVRTSLQFGKKVKLGKIYGIWMESLLLHNFELYGGIYN